MGANMSFPWWRVPRTRLPEVVAERGARHRADQAVDNRRAEAFGGPLRLDLTHRHVGRRDLRIEDLAFVGKTLPVRAVVPGILGELVALRGEIGVHGRQVGDRGIVGLVRPIEEDRRPHTFARVLRVQDRGAVAALGLVGDDGAALRDAS